MTSQQSWILASKSAPCILCGKPDWCRVAPDESAVLCRRIDFAPLGWKRIKTPKDNIGGIFVLEAEQEFDRERWLRERRLQQKQQEVPKGFGGLDPLKRDREFRKLLDQLSLNPIDAEDLYRRGFTPELLKLFGAKSIKRREKLDFPVSNRLPGIAPDGRSLSVALSDEGILCPIKNADGLIIGCQLRRRENLDIGGRTSRYKWLTSKSDYNPNGSTSHLPNGELPLTVQLPTVWNHSLAGQIGLAEGTGIKPFLAAQRLGIPVIGAASGNFASSPEQLKAAVEKLSELWQAELGEVELKLVLFPDAGAIVNSTMLKQYDRAICLLQEWGHEVALAWWGQSTKNDPDIDEIKGDIKFDLLTWGEFTGSVVPTSEPDPQAYAEYQQQLAEEEQVAAAAAAERQLLWADPEQQALRDRNRWRNAKRYTPTHTINQQYFDWEVPHIRALLAIKSGLGTGKTHWLSWVISQLHDDKILALGYRNTLLIQSVERWKNGFYHLHNDSAYLFTADPNYRLALCVDSLMRFNDDDFNDATVLIDEVMSVISHLLTSSTLAWRRDLILEKFTQALRRAKRIVILDGHLADWAVNYITTLAGSREVIKVENLHKGDPFKIIFNLGSMLNTPNGEQLCSNDRSAFVKRIQEAECSVVCTDSQTEAETLDEILSKLDLDTFRLDGKTSDKDYAKEFITNPDEYLTQHRIDSLLYTGTAESGLDISIRNYFTDQYGIFFGVVSVDACLQQMARVRDPNIVRHVWAREFSINDNENFKSYQPKQLERTLTAYHNLVSEELTTGVDNSEAKKALFHDLINNSHDAHEKAWQVLKSISNYERANFRSCLLERLQDKYGDNVRVITSDRSEEDATLYKDQREEVKKLECSQIFNSEDIDPSAARQINASFGASWEERCQAIKAVYLEMLPGIKDATKLDDKGASVPVWSVDFIYRIRKRDRNFVKACQLAWLLEHPEVAKLQDQVHWARLISTRDKTFLPDHKSRYAQVLALQELGILEFIKAENLEKRYTSDSPEIIALVERGKNKRLSTALGVSPGKQPGVKYLGRVLGLLGICTASKAIKDGETVIREYWVESRSLTDPDRAAVMQCLCKKWERYQNGEVEIPKFILFQQLKDLEEMEQKSAPESPTVQGVDPVADTTINVYKLEPSATLEAQTPTTVVAPQERSQNDQAEILTVEPLVTQNEAVKLVQISEPQKQSGQGVDPVADNTGCLYKLDPSATRSAGQPKVGDRIRVNLPGYIPDGLEGVVLAVQSNDKFPLLINLEAPPELPWLREYRAKAEWLEVVA